MLRLHLATTLEGDPIALGRSADEARARAAHRLRDSDDELNPVTMVLPTPTAATLARTIRLGDIPEQLAELGLS
jgi:hypothetical protein